MNLNDPFKTKCRCNGELLGILAAAENTKQIATLYYSNEQMVKDDDCLKEQFSDKRSQLSLLTPPPAIAAE